MEDFLDYLIIICAIGTIAGIAIILLAKIADCIDKHLNYKIKRYLERLFGLE